MDASAVCVELTAQTNAWLADPNHFSCNVDGDCMAEPDQGSLYEQGVRGSCWPRTVISKQSAVGFEALIGKMFDAKCAGPSNICSGSLCGTPGCEQHVCICR